MSLLKLIIKWIRKHLVQLKSIKYNWNDWSNLIIELLCRWRSPNDKFIWSKQTRCKEAYYNFTSNDHGKKLYFCGIFKDLTTPHKPFWIHQHLYFHEMCNRIVGTYQKLPTEAWNNIQSASFNISKME